MANSTEYVRKTIKRKRTDKNNGDEITIKLVHLDNGQMYLNNAPMNTNGTGNWIGAARFAMQQIEIFHDDLKRGR